MKTMSSLLKSIWSTATILSRREIQEIGPFPLLPVLHENINPENIPREIKRVQDILISKRYLCERQSTGEFDRATQDAVKNFQRDNGLVADGIVATLTWAALLYPRLSRLSQSSEENKSAIRKLQKNLSEMGLKNVDINGTFDDITERAVKQFQQAYGLQIDGVVGPMTMSTLLGQKHQPDLSGKQAIFHSRNMLALRPLIPVFFLSLGIIVSPFKESLTILEIISNTYALVCVVPYVSERLSFKTSSVVLESSPYFLTGFMSPYFLQAIKKWATVFLTK